MWLTKALALSLAIAMASAAAEERSAHLAVLADGSLALGLKLYHAMAKDKGTGNILLSPVMLASSLGTVALGAQGTTASEAKSLLGMGKVEDGEFHRSVSQLLAGVGDPAARNGTWKTGSHIYGPTSVKFTKDFVQDSKKHYGLEHSKINFRDKKGALKSINEWAAKTTESKLPEITKDLEKTDGTVIINAIYFKPHWNERFHHKMVDQRSFTVTRSESIAIKMMHRTGLYNFYKDETNQVYVVEMPLSRELSSVIFIMPFQLQDLGKIEKVLNKEQIEAWVNKLQRRALAISLPKGIFGVSHQLQKHLGGVGLAAAVDKSKADLSKISGKKDLYLASVIHGTAWEWDTEGDPFDPFIYNGEVLKDPEIFYVDHPFIFLVKDKKSGAILFIGRLVRPDGRKMHDEL